jgi:hypothetical protein
MVTQAVKSLSIVRTFSGNMTPYADELLEGDSQDGAIGECVSFDANGHVQKRAAQTDLCLGSLTTAQQNSATAETDGDKSKFVYWTSDCILEGSVEKDVAASSVLAQNLVGNDYGIKESAVTANRWVVDLDETTNVSVRIIKLVDAVGDLYGKVQCVPIAAKCIVGG